MTLTFLELELPLGIVRDRLAGDSSTLPVELESSPNWDRFILEDLQQQLPDGKLLRWALTSVCDRRQTITVEVVATLPDPSVDT